MGRLHHDLDAKRDVGESHLLSSGCSTFGSLGVKG